MWFLSLSSDFHIKSNSIVNILYTEWRPWCRGKHQICRKMPRSMTSSPTCRAQTMAETTSPGTQRSPRTAAEAANTTKENMSNTSTNLSTQAWSWTPCTARPRPNIWTSRTKRYRPSKYEPQIFIKLEVRTSSEWRRLSWSIRLGFEKRLEEKVLLGERRLIKRVPTNFQQLSRRLNKVVFLSMVKKNVLGNSCSWLKMKSIRKRRQSSWSLHQGSSKFELRAGLVRLMDLRNSRTAQRKTRKSFKTIQIG